MARFAQIFATIACSLIACSRAFGGEGTSILGRRATNFALNDFYGKQHSLAECKDKKLVVLAFLGTECPLARLYAARLVELERKYADKGVQYFGIDANRQDSVTDLVAFARQYGIRFPLLKDLNNKVADQFHAMRTPEIFVLDQDRVVRYHGRVDDQYGVGYSRKAPAKAFLARALDELLEGKTVTQAETNAVGCLIGRVRSPDVSSSVTYSKQVVRILDKHCVSCHRPGEIAPFALTTYGEVSGWADTIAEVVRERRMPPWPADPAYGQFANDRSLSGDEKKILCDWAAAGAPKGDLSDLPAPPKFVEGWQLPKPPDKIYDISASPVKVPAQGTVPYQFFHVDPGFDEDKWITGLEIRPGNRAVVHHIMVIAHPKRAGAKRLHVRADQPLLSFVPGGIPLSLPKGMARLLPADYEFLLEVHYTPNGSEQFDNSKLGVIFAEPSEVKQRVLWLYATNHSFAIPPEAEHYKVEADSTRLGGRMQILRLYPHMHLRGKQFRIEARSPEGRSEILLDVPRYDFGWQLTYELAKPKAVTKGTVVHCTAYFDNSLQNPNNPDPQATVREGDQTWEEMMVGHFDVVFPVNLTAARATSKKAR